MGRNVALDSAAHDRGKELMHEGTPGRTRARDDESANQPGQVLREFDDLELGAGVRGPDQGLDDARDPRGEGAMSQRKQGNVAEGAEPCEGTASRDSDFPGSLPSS